MMLVCSSTSTVKGNGQHTVPLHLIIQKVTKHINAKHLVICSTSMPEKCQYILSSILAENGKGITSQAVTVLIGNFK